MATQKTRPEEPRKIRSLLGATFALLVLTGMGASAHQDACPLSVFLGVPVTAMLECLPSILLSAGHLFLRCALQRVELLEPLLRLSACWWHFVLSLAAVT